MASIEKNIKPYEILIVLDSHSKVKSISEILESTQTCYNLNSITNIPEMLMLLGREGEYADAPCPDIIFIDLNLLTISGCESVRSIKENPDLKDIPLVVMSATAKDIIKISKLRTSGFITIPG